MMIAREQADDATKQEGNTGGDDKKTTNSKASSSSAAAASWSRLKDPRIVRVSRAFGGKDRHSKVCTVRGLRDRRVRLSVPTAIQLYDLQDRLGLNQPSKVVDWLLDAAKNEIDELPPLQMPPGSLISHNFQTLLNPHPQSISNKEPRIGSSGINWTDPPETSGSNNTWNSRSKELASRESNEEGKHDQSSFEDHHNNFFSSRPHGNIGLLNNNLSAQPYSSLIRWDPSTLSLAQSGLTPHHHQQQQQQEDNFQNFNVSLASSGGPHQVLVYQQPPGITQSYFPSPINFQMLNSNSDNPLSNSLDSASSQQGRPFHFHMSTTTTNFLPTVPEDRGNELTNNEGDFRSR